MNENQISNILSICLMILVPIALILLLIFIILSVRERTKGKSKNKPVVATESKEVAQTKTGRDYSKLSIFSFMEFDKIEDNMIVRKNGNKFIMVIECQGINYDLMSGLEKNSVERGFLQFLNTLRTPIQLYIQTRTVNLSSSIARYKERMAQIRDDYNSKQMRYNSLVVSADATPKEVQEAKYDLIKVKNLYEYGNDIIENTERMNLNKNILKKQYYIVISYTPEEGTGNYDKEEIKNMAFSDLYTRCQAIISSIGVCGVAGKVLDSEELAELLYYAYNRDEAEIYDLDKVLKSGAEDLYSTSRDVLDKRMEEINKEVEAKAVDLANEKAMEAFESIEKQRRVKQREAQMNEMIDVLAKNLLNDNVQILGPDVVNEAKRLIEQASASKKKTDAKANAKKDSNVKEEVTEKKQKLATATSTVKTTKRGRPKKKVVAE